MGVALDEYHSIVQDAASCRLASLMMRLPLLLQDLQTRSTRRRTSGSGWR